MHYKGTAGMTYTKFRDERGDGVEVGAKYGGGSARRSPAEDINTEPYYVRSSIGS